MYWCIRHEDYLVINRHDDSEQFSGEKDQGELMKHGGAIGEIFRTQTFPSMEVCLKNHFVDT